MTPIESMYEIQSDVLDLERYLNSRNAVVSKRAQMKYKQRGGVDRFFSEKINLLESEKRNIFLRDFDYFLRLRESTIEYYDFN
jgi:hypothetical protein